MWDETVKIISQGNLDDSKPVYWTKLDEAETNNPQQDPRQCMMFHFALWLSANPDVTEYRAIVDGDVLSAPIAELRRHPFYVLFGQKKDKLRFERWLKRYSTWFVGVSLRNEIVPPMPECGTYTLTFVRTPFVRQDFYSSGEFPEGFVDRWAWVIQHCRKPVYMLFQRGFAFSDENEGLMYKLQWAEDGQ